MSIMPGRVTKTIGFESFDKEISNNHKLYQERYAKDPQIDELLDQAVQDGIITDDTRKHVRADWLQAFWPKVKHANRILQRGLYWAVYAARHDEDGVERTAPLPICSLWVCTGEYGDPRFEVASIVSKQQVTVVFLTPPPEKELKLPPGPALQPVWSTRSEAYPEVPGEKLIGTWFNTVTVRPFDGAGPE
jgi:hypothetical protein